MRMKKSHCGKAVTRISGGFEITRVQKSWREGVLNEYTACIYASYHIIHTACSIRAQI